MHAARRKFGWVAAIVVAAAPPLARAEDAGGPGRDLLTRWGEYVLLGGGVTAFTDSKTKDALDTGGAWSARLGIGSRSFVGAEAAYVGSYRSVKGSDEHLTMNGAEGIVRVQYPWEQGTWRLAPFAFGGIGWDHLSISNSPPGVKASDDIGVVPFGAGVTVGFSRVLVDARFTYRTTFSEDLPGPGGGTLALQHWTVGASVGMEF